MRAVATIDVPASAPLYKRFRSAQGEHLLVVPHSRLFDLPEEVVADFDARPEEAFRLANMLAEARPGEAGLDVVVEPPPQSVSLNVSSACNLACGYCYADRGAFGGKQAEVMTLATAISAVDRLVDSADPAHPVTVGFLGGEPLVNRQLVHSVVAHASRRGADRGLDVRFSITTNGTLLTKADIDLICAHRFAVTVSLDGGAQAHDLRRSDKNGHGSFARVVERVAPLLERTGRGQVAARVTVGRHTFDLAARLQAIWDIGFQEAGVAPLRAASDGSNIGESEWPSYLEQLMEVTRGELRRACAGDPIRLTNLAVALKQIHVGASSPYPCGAGGGYFSVAADGRWYACHRAIGDDKFLMGESTGLDAKRRRVFLLERHVHAQSSCSTCWARYLCSGSCHQEASNRTAAGCDFIRGWLEFCLAAYCELLAERPSYFSEPTNTSMSRQ